MKIIALYARCKNYGIGVNNTIPWNISKEMAHFKKETMGHYVVMGRKTFESLPTKRNGELLPGRDLLVLSRDKNFKVESPNVMVFSSKRSLLRHLKLKREINKKVFICGGSEIYNLFYKNLTGIVESVVHGDYSVDSILPVEYRSKKQFTEFNKEHHKCFDVRWFIKTN